MTFGIIFNFAKRAALLAAYALLFSFGHKLHASDTQDYFPLAKGNYWIYRGETKYLVRNPDTDANEPKAEILTWKMEVIDTVTRDRIFASRIKGFPFELSWYQPGKERGDYLILRVGTATYYLLRGDAAIKAWKILKDEMQPLGDLDKEGELLLDAPLMEGKVFNGDFPNLARGRCCWVVEGRNPFNPHQFPAAGKITNPCVFTLAYYTNPDRQILDFVPGLGIAGYQYIHHGTLAETNLTLVEFGTLPPK